jgi:hypothetical protein
MSNREPTATTPLDQLSATEPLAWKRARDLLDAGALNEAASFLGTVRHVAKFRWEAVADDGSTGAAGLNVLVLAADGRVPRNDTFVDGA